MPSNQCLFALCVRRWRFGDNVKPLLKPRKHGSYKGQRTELQPLINTNELFRRISFTQGDVLAWQYLAEINDE